MAARGGIRGTVEPGQRPQPGPCCYAIRSTVTGRMLSQGRHGKNKAHRIVSLCRDGKGHSRLVHHLVLEAFFGPCPPGMQACHYDDVGSNNNLANLRWDTQSANTFDSYRNGLRTPPTGGSERHTHCKNGHEFTPENTYTHNAKQQVCKACSLEWQRRKRARRRVHVL